MNFWFGFSLIHQFSFEIIANPQAQAFDAIRLPPGVRCCQTRRLVVRLASSVQIQANFNSWNVIWFLARLLLLLCEQQPRNLCERKWTTRTRAQEPIDHQLRLVCSNLQLWSSPFDDSIFQFLRANVFDAIPKRRRNTWTRGFPTEWWNGPNLKTKLSTGVIILFEISFCLMWRQWLISDSNFSTEMELKEGFCSREREFDPPQEPAKTWGLEYSYNLLVIFRIAKSNKIVVEHLFTEPKTH